MVEVERVKEREKEGGREGAWAREGGVVGVVMAGACLDQSLHEPCFTGHRGSGKVHVWVRSQGKFHDNLLTWICSLIYLAK